MYHTTVSDRHPKFISNSYPSLSDSLDLHILKLIEASVTPVDRVAHHDSLSTLREGAVTYPDSRRRPVRPFAVRIRPHTACSPEPCPRAHTPYSVPGTLQHRTQQPEPKHLNITWHHLADLVTCTHLRNPPS